MATLKVEDSLDIDRFLNLEGTYSPSISPSISKGKAIINPEYRPPVLNTNTFAPLQQSSHTFSGPSHQYDLHKQHIPLPPGALANSLAATQRPTFQYNGYSQEIGMGSNTGMPFDLNTGEEFFDFNAAQGHNPSFSSSTDMEMDFDSPVDGMFVDPNAVGGQEEESPTPTRAEIVRAYPGMHAHQAQQAALAKQQQQMEIQRQQQQRAAQRPQGTSSHKHSSSRSAGNRSPMDPAVEERISRLLSQMRQSSDMNDADGSRSSPQPTLSKSKKDEEDMDEDERLLASEEGKKLSSKERRQLRNKVSARAFRSRRKEYIGQLEGEVAVKATEADTLRAECEALRAENSRLTDLTKLLLSSSAFSTFLNDLSANGLPPSIGQSVQEPIQSQASQEATQNRQQYQMQQQNNAQIGMVTIPESHMDFTVADNINNNWNVGVDFNYNPQVFSVTELPQGPAVDSIDVGVLSGKSEGREVREMFSEKKESVPTIETAPSVVKVEPEFVTRNDVEFDESDPAFALFADAPAVSKPSEPVYQIFGPIDFEKAVEHFEIVVDDTPSSDDGVVSASTMARFERLCTDLASTSEKLDGLISRS